MSVIYRTLFDPTEIPADLRQYFEEFEAACSAPWRRVVERTPLSSLAVRYVEGESPKHAGRIALGLRSNRSGLGGSNSHNPSTPNAPEVRTVDWRPTCACNAGDPRPATVLDPFAGSGTTLMVADRLGRDAIGIELRPEYAEMALKRVEADRLARDPILREQAAARAGGWTAPTLFSLEAATGEKR